MAEWLADNVLGWEKRPHTKKDIHSSTGLRDTEAWFISQRNPVKLNENLLKFIYSPDGFFAVVKAIPNDKWSHKLYKAWYLFLPDMDMEAFYNAVYEAMK